MRARQSTTRAATGIVPGIACLLVCSGLQAQAPHQNGVPEKLLDHSWAVNLSKRPASNEDCNDKGCLETTEQFKFIHNPADSNRVVLVIANSNDRIEHLDAQLVGREPAGGGSGGNRYVEIVFDDTIADPENPPRRRMCLHSVRMHGTKTTKDETCADALLRLSDGNFTDAQQVDPVCDGNSVAHLVYWRVSDFPEPCSGAFPATRGNPDTGHGTAGGGN